MIWTFLIVCTGLASAYEKVHPQRLSELRDAGNDEEFARLLGIDVEFVRPSNDERDDIDERSKPVSPLGDIMLTNEQSEQARLTLDFHIFRNSLWRNCTIYYWIDERGYDWNQLYIIIKTIEEFNRDSSHLKLLPYPRTHFVWDFLYIFNGIGCWSFVGRLGFPQPLSLQNVTCVSQNIVMHKLMHAAGFLNEENRPDRDNHIEILWENIPEEMRPRYGKFNDSDPVVAGQCYDYYSIMHAPVEVPGNDTDAYRVLLEGVDKNVIGRGESLSPLDVRKLNDAYRHCERIP